MHISKVSIFSGTDLLRYFLLTIAGLIFLGAFVLSYLQTGRFIFGDPPPQFEGFYLWALFLAMSSALLFVVSIINHSSPINLLKKISSSFTSFDVSGLRWLIITPATVLWSTLGLSFALVLLFAISPGIFSQLSNEDQIIEISSALLLFLACITLVILYLDCSRTNKLDKLWLPGLLGLAFILFVIGMEEVSWFQRSFGIRTPEALSGNKQGEMNLHNFASNTSEIVYYFASFVYLIAFPFVYEQMRALSQLKVVTFFAPGLTTLFVSAPLVAFNYNLWNHPTMQFAFFATLAILIFYTWRSFTEPTSPRWLRYYLISLCLACALAQFIFIWRGYTFLKGWEVTEYKEFLIPLAFYIYAVELVMRQKGSIGPKFVGANIMVGLVVAGLRLLQW